MASSSQTWHNAKWISRKYPKNKFDFINRKLSHFRNIFGINSKYSSEMKMGAPLFRKEFHIEKAIKSAILYISGLGYYEAWINHRRVGNHVLDPAQTDYEQRVFYVVHEVTDLIHSKDNCIGIMLGNGWYNQDKVWGKKGLSYGIPCLISRLQIELADGTSMELYTDKTWKCSSGPIIDNNIYAGESYDARLEQQGWDLPKFDDSFWDKASYGSEPKGVLIPQKMPPIRKIDELSPRSIYKKEENKYIVDFGQNFAGWVKISLNTQAGKEIYLRFAEKVDDENNIETSSTGVFATGVEQIDRYITKGGGIEVWEPRFSYHGFRYVEITGWPNELEKEDIIGVVVHTDLPEAGDFNCSDERLNQLHQMALWTFRSNIHGIPEDCPARERCGWLGDANMDAEYSIWNYNAKKFWEKYLDDIETTRLKNKGIPCNIAPGKRGTNKNANPDWAATFIMLPWYLYNYYGDHEVIQNHWDGMQVLMEYFRKISQNWIIKAGYGDWFDPGDKSICTNTPPAFTSSCWFFRCAEAMESMAKALKQQENAIEYAKWAKNIKSSIIQNFYDKQKGSFGSQTANTMALEFGIIPEGEEDRIVSALVLDIKGHDNHFTTGIFGIRYLFEILTRYNHGDVALALLHQNSYPSFGYLISLGATTLWESWGEPKHDELYGPRSLNHPMMGGYDNWFFNTLAGIRPDPKKPGFKHFFLKPYPIDGLDWVQCKYESSNGYIKSEWKLIGHQFEWNIEIPKDSSATIILPFSQNIVNVEEGQYHFMDEKRDEGKKSNF